MEDLSRTTTGDDAAAGAGANNELHTSANSSPQTLVGRDVVVEVELIMGSVGVLQFSNTALTNATMACPTSELAILWGDARTRTRHGSFWRCRRGG